MVNDQHTKVGITKKSFASRCKGYIDNFDNKVNFIPLAIVPSDQLDEAEGLYNANPQLCEDAALIPGIIHPAGCS